MYRKGETTGSNKANRKLCEGSLEIAVPLDDKEEELLFDPQTSGGLLLSVPAGRADSLVRELRTAGVAHAALVGEIVAAETPIVRIV
jgi:selenide,water dikinase